LPPSGKKPGLPEVLFFHTVSIELYGGSEGVRDRESLHAAIERPWQASFGREHFSSPFEKAAALMESIIRRHPFVDGNKRTATASASYLPSTFDIEVEGVDYAFRFLMRQTQKIYYVHCKLETDESISKVKNLKLATNIYHVIQEAIKNSAVHGKAKNIEISIMESKDDIILKITDDGVGLVDSPKEGNGKGLRIMMHRIELVGGTFDIADKSDPDEKGVVITCTIPLEYLYKKDE
jgi:death-on-curing family protein